MKGAAGCLGFPCGGEKGRLALGTRGCHPTGDHCPPAPSSFPRLTAPCPVRPRGGGAKGGGGQRGRVAGGGARRAGRAEPREERGAERSGAAGGRAGGPRPRGASSRTNGRARGALYGPKAERGPDADADLAPGAWRPRRGFWASEVPWAPASPCGARAFLCSWVPPTGPGLCRLLAFGGESGCQAPRRTFSLSRVGLVTSERCFSVLEASAWGSPQPWAPHSRLFGMEHPDIWGQVDPVSLAEGLLGEL